MRGLGICCGDFAPDDSLGKDIERSELELLSEDVEPSLLDSGSPFSSKTSLSVVTLSLSSSLLEDDSVGESIDVSVSAYNGRELRSSLSSSLLIEPLVPVFDRHSVLDETVWLFPSSDSSLLFSVVEISREVSDE